MIGVLMMICIMLWVASFSFVVPTLWGWFMVPLGVGAITPSHAFGLLMLKATLWQKEWTKDTREDEERLTDLAGRTLFLWMAWVIALLCTTLMGG